MAKTRDDDPMTEEEKSFYNDLMKNFKTYKKKIEVGVGIPFEHDYKNENDDVFTEIRNEWKE